MSTKPHTRTRHPRLGQSYGFLPATDFTTGTDLNLSDGFALFPALGTIRALKEYRATGVPLGDYDNTLDQFALVFNANLLAFYGIAGPSYVADVRTTSNNTWDSTPAGGTDLTLEISSARFAAGIEAGFTVTAQMNCVLVDLSHNQTLIDFSPNCAIDVINLLVQLIEIALDDENDPSPLTKLDNLTNNGVLSSWGIYDQNLNAFQIGTPGYATAALSTTLNPTFTLPINIVSLLDGVPGADILPALDEALAEIDGGFSFGPSFVFGIPTTISVPSVQLDGETLPASNYSTGPNSVTPFFDNPHAVLSAPPTSIGMTFEHTVSFSFGVGFFANVQAAKIFNLPYNSPTLDLLELFDITAPTFGPYDNTLTYSTSGNRQLPDAPTSAPTITGWFETQPFHQYWVGGVIAQYAVSFTDGSYETPIGPWTPTDPTYARYALARLADVPTDPAGLATGRNVYRTFGDGTTTLVGTIPDNTTTTFVDNNY